MQSRAGITWARAAPLQHSGLSLRLQHGEAAPMEPFSTGLRGATRVEERTFVCAACGEEKVANPRLKPGVQMYCSQPTCYLAGRSVRQKERMADEIGRAS